MVRTLATRLAVAAALVGALAACASETPADEAPADAIAEPAVLKERHDNFESIGDAFKAVRGELEKDTPDFGLIAASANDINARAGNIERHFVERTSIDDGYDTEALATIWEKPVEFKAAAQKLLDESADLAVVAASEDKAAVAAQAMAMGGACKDCHDQFRLDDEK